MIKKLQIFQSVKLHGCGRYYEDEYKSNFSVADSKFFKKYSLKQMFPFSKTDSDADVKLMCE